MHCSTCTLYILIKYMCKSLGKEWHKDEIVLGSF